jgi:hypothetical protein
MKGDRAGHFSQQVVGKKQGLPFPLENNGTGPADPKLHRTFESTGKCFQNPISRTRKIWKRHIFKELFFTVV